MQSRKRWTKFRFINTLNTPSPSPFISILRVCYCFSNVRLFLFNQDLNASLSASVAREQETSGQVESLEKTRNELVAELNRCIEQGKKRVWEAFKIGLL